LLWDAAENVSYYVFHFVSSLGLLIYDVIFYTIKLLRIILWSLKVVLQM